MQTLAPHQPEAVAPAHIDNCYRNQPISISQQSASRADFGLRWSRYSHTDTLSCCITLKIYAFEDPLEDPIPFVLNP